MTDFGGVPDQHLDPGVFNGYLIIVLVSKIGSVGPWRGHALSKCSWCIVRFLSVLKIKNNAVLIKAKPLKYYKACYFNVLG